MLNEGNSLPISFHAMRYHAALPRFREGGLFIRVLFI